ncbi:hypothetical protein QZH41_013635 [Actinostola sp. cb2023]|nr:hypothetical protein QZH41_013635 [Actinostola sp. cb2023]
MSAAALWTDGRYYEQAAMQMDSNWLLMKSSGVGLMFFFGIVRAFFALTPSCSSLACIAAGLGGEREGEGEERRNLISSPPHFSSSQTPRKNAKELAKKGIVLQSVLPNLVDEIWTNQPPLPNGTIFSLSLEFTGKKWQDKIKDLRNTMKSKSATAVVLYQLDEIAWLLNVRGSDIPYNPVFFSYVIVTMDQVNHDHDAGVNDDDVALLLQAQGIVRAELAP